jgi:ferritin
MNGKIEQAFNDQINAEYFSAYLYLSMANHFANVNLEGMSHWMRLQWGEEQQHALKFVDFVHDRGGTVKLTAIEGPDTEWDSPLAVFEQVLEHEQKVTGLINDLVDLAVAESDHAANAFLQWFVSEQVEEEATAQGIVDKLKIISDSGAALLMLDAQLGARAAAPAGE